MPVEIVIPGNANPVSSSASIKTYFPEADIQSFTVETNRSALAGSARINVGHEDVVVTKFENNIRWIQNGGEFVGKLRGQQPPTRGADSNELVVPALWQEQAAGSRGAIGTALKLVGIEVVKNVAGKAIAKEIAARIEQNNPNILFSCDEEFNLVKQFDAGTASNVTGHYLLFIHGTGSNTKSGFGGLTNVKTGNLYKTLFEKYGGRIIAYEHKTFTQSPVQNVIELVKQFPKNITLDIISHSRGGLVGEVLARISAEGWAGAFTTEEMDLLSKNEDAATLLGEIKQLQKISADRQLKVNRFVRVACPAAGTTLVSDRAEKVLNVLFNILTNLPGVVASTIFEGLEALITAIVNEKNNTATLPGIECMKPDSDFIKVLNFSKTKIESDLVVIAGDAQGDGFISKMKMLVVDAFYREDNDLVVNTASMKKGTARSTAFAIYDEKGGTVDHFNYFLNDSSKRIILQVLTGKIEEVHGLYSSTSNASRAAEPDLALPASRAAKTIEGQPVVYVLPGIMGSNLKAGEAAIWVNYLSIATGGLSHLKLAPGDGVTATSINGSAYKKLVDYLAADYYVIPFAYDWRRSVYDAAEDLKKSVEDSLAKKAKSISFIAHSMGGLVFRAFATKYPAIWEQLAKSGQCRVLMLGTPNLGSYVVPRLMMGIGKSINSIAALDLTSNKRKLLGQFVQYKGLLELLPAKGKDDFSSTAFWTEIMNTAGGGYPIPASTDLESYVRLQQDDFKNFVFDPSVIKYVAGKDDQTPCGLFGDAGKINFLATPRGDGTVTWDSIPPALLNTATYYTNAEHGCLARHEDAFAGYKELIATGETTLLSTIPPVTRGVSAIELMPEQDAVTTPDEATLPAAIMGIPLPEIKAPSQDVKVFITNADLGHAMYPLIAGHFMGDGIVEAEKVLDRKLNNYLSIRHATNNYPNEVGTHEVIINKPTKPPGAIIVGLGHFGSLSESNLTVTLKQALLSYVIKSKEEKTIQPGGAETLGISYLLIGSGFGGLSIADSIKAVLNAVKETNSFFENSLQTGYQRIGYVEIIELYQYKAIQAGRTILGMINNSNLFKNITFSPNTIKKGSGFRNEIPGEMQAGWWQRLKIALKDETEVNGKKISRSIVFSSITDKARSEEVVLSTNIGIVDKLIKEAAAVTNNNRLLCQTLYELLVPNNFKGYSTDLRSMVLVLDKETARYPWEMMLDAYGDNKEPIVTKTGFIRQLSTGTYRQNTRITTADNALVIGNPNLNNYYPSLPGAATEAKQVSERLHMNGYQVKPYTFIEKDAQDLIPYMYTQPFKILHIAAHGVVNDKLTGLTGVVIGEGLILTPSDFDQMRNVPELVFINCCSLGTIDKADEERLQRKYQVAAGIGTQLIEMGVKAVIVAGWEVNDDAALCFSDNFYAYMLQGSTYGEAVKLARSITYTNYPDMNTWGAYQCYGDPFYTFRVIDSNAKKKYTFCDIVEATNKLQNLVSEIESASTRDENDWIKNEILCVVKAMEEHAGWTNDALVIEQLAELYKELGEFKLAIGYYEQLFSIEKAFYSIRTVEQYCNIKVKYTFKEWKLSQQGTIAAKAAATVTADAIITDMINTLQKVSIRPTTERLNLVASAYRRLADIHYASQKAYRANLVKAAGYYQQAYMNFQMGNGKVYYYPFFNWLIITAVITDLVTKAEKEEFPDLFTVPENMEQLMQDASLYASELDQQRPDFWNKTADSTQFLYRLITAGTRKEIELYQQKIIDNHYEAWRTEGSANKGNSIGDHIDFITGMFESYKTKPDSLKLVSDKLHALAVLKEKLDA